MRVPGVTPNCAVPAGPLTDLHGQPEIIHTPGHTDGECVVLLPDRSAILTGDALVTLDPYTGRRGPRIIAPAATHDSQQALASLDALTTWTPISSSPDTALGGAMASRPRSAPLTPVAYPVFSEINRSQTELLFTL